MEKKNIIKIKANDLMGRGEFLKRLGGGAAVTAAALAGCDKSAVSTCLDSGIRMYALAYAQAR